MENEEKITLETLKEDMPWQIISVIFSIGMLMIGTWLVYTKSDLGRIIIATAFFVGGIGMYVQAFIIEKQRRGWQNREK